jgi:hypothetical protein
MRALAGRELEHCSLPLLLRRGGQQVEERLLLRLAQGGKVIQRCKRGRRKMRTARDTAGATMVEHHTAPEQRWSDTHILVDTPVLHDGGDRVGVELYLDLVGEPQTASAGDRSGIEDATKVLGRERRRHRRGLTSGGGRGGSDESPMTGADTLTGCRRLLKLLMQGTLLASQRHIVSPSEPTEPFLRPCGA